MQKINCSSVSEAFSKAKVLLQYAKEDPSYVEDTKLAFIEFYLEQENGGEYDAELYKELSELFDEWYRGNDSIETVCERFNASAQRVLH